MAIFYNYSQLIPAYIVPEYARKKRVVRDNAFFIDKRYPLLSIRVRGLWAGEWIFQVRHGKQYVRRATAYDLGPKAYLAAYQPKFADAVHAWQSLTPEVKASLDSRASKLGLRLAGYHYFISLYLKDKPALEKYYP